MTDGQARRPQDRGRRRDAGEAAVAARRAGVLERTALAVVRADTLALPEVVVAEARRITKARASALVLLADDGELELLASVGRDRAQVDRWRRFPRSGAPAIGRAVYEGRPVIATSGMFGDLRAVGDAGIGLCTPLLVDGAPIGAVGIDLTLPSTEAADGRLLLLADFAEISANALDRARRSRLYDRSSRLQILTAKLVQAIGPDEVADAIVEQGVEALGAFAGTVAILSDDGARLTISAARGYPEDAVAAWQEFPIEAPYPLSHAARTKEDVLLESRAAVADRFPAVREVGEKVGGGALMALPLVIENRVLGALGFTFAAPRTFDWADRGFIRSLAQLCAQALDRAQQARLRDRTARLQTITAALSRSSTLSEVAHVIVTEGIAALGASAGTVAVFHSGANELELVASSGYPEALVDAWRRLPVDLPVPLADALRLNEPVVLESPAAIETRYAGGSGMVETLGERALVALPLRLRGESLGAIGFTFAEPIAFVEEDRAFLSALAELCAQAFERARLYERLAAAADRLRHLLERLHDGVVALRPDLTIGFANREAQNLIGTGVRENEQLPEPWPSFSLRRFAAGLVEPGAAGGSGRVELADKTLELIGIPSEDEAVLVIRDVTRRERQERAEREFIANAAHELRTPLAGIAAAVDALQLGAVDIPEQRKRFLDGIAHETARLTSLVRALLMLARVQSNPETIQRENVELAPLLVETARQLDLAPGVTADVECPARLGVWANRTLLEASIRNLGQNATRHTRHGSITLSGARIRPGTVGIEVRDTGSGIPADARARIFERFYRGADEREGFGLGLPLVREMVTALGGEVDIESEWGVGTTVRMTLQESSA